MSESVGNRGRDLALGSILTTFYKQILRRKISVEFVNETYSFQLGGRFGYLKNDIILKNLLLKEINHTKQ